MYHVNPNQRIIQVVSKNHDKENNYGCISRKAEYIAAHILADGSMAYVLYVHFVLNQNNYTFALSPKALNTELGISDKQYRRAISKLEQAGYLVRSKPGSNLCFFYELPPQYEGVHFDLEASPPVGEECISLEGEVSLPAEGDGVSLEGERNSTKNNTEDSTINSTTKKELSSREKYERYMLEEQKRKEEEQIRAYRERRRWLPMVMGAAHKMNGFMPPDDYELPAREIKVHPLDYQEKNHAWEVKRKFILSQVRKRDRATDDKAKKILDVYLRAHKESPAVENLGRKYGRWIRGWDKEKQEPKICYSFHWLPDELIKHDTEGIPENYYMQDMHEDLDNPLPF